MNIRENNKMIPIEKIEKHNVINDNNKTIEVIEKIYPSNSKNSKGTYIGKILFEIKGELPTNFSDEVEFYLNSLLKTIANDEKKLGDPTKKLPEEMNPYFIKKIKFTPYYEENDNNTKSTQIISRGGKRKIKKTIKKRTKKNITKKSI